MEKCRAFDKQERRCLRISTLAVKWRGDALRVTDTVSCTEDVPPSWNPDAEGQRVHQSRVRFSPFCGGHSLQDLSKVFIDGKVFCRPGFPQTVVSCGAGEIRRIWIINRTKPCTLSVGPNYNMFIPM